MFHGLRRGSCEIVDIDELDDFDDLPHRIHCSASCGKMIPRGRAAKHQVKTYPQMRLNLPCLV